nr:ATP synthase F0 subunit 8 [Toxodera hauseri]
MPQMMPLNWLMLFAFFVMFLFLLNILNYYTVFNKSTSKISQKPGYKTLNWKW